jgi:hypothetical protein
MAIEQHRPAFGIDQMQNLVGIPDYGGVLDEVRAALATAQASRLAATIAELVYRKIHHGENSSGSG